MQEISPENWLENIQSDWLPLLLEYGMSILFALITLAIGWCLVNRVVNALTTVLLNLYSAAILSIFLISVLCTLMSIRHLAIVAVMLGIETTSFFAIIASSGLT